MDGVFRCRCKTGQDFLTFDTKNENTFRVFLAANNASSNVQMIYFKNLLVHLTTTVCFWIGNITFFDYCMSLQHFFHQKIVQLHQELFGFQFFFSPSNQTIRGSLKEHSAIKLFTSTYTL